MAKVAARPGARPSRPAPGAKARLVTLALSVVAPALLALLGYQRRWLCDDAFIDFRVVRFLREGFGPRFNLAERVEAYTNPLWVALLWAANALGVRLESAAVALGLCAAVAGVVALQWGAARLARRDGGVQLPVGAICLVAVPAVWDFATSGLETGLALLWIGGTAAVLGAAASPRRDDLRPLVGASAALAALWVGSGVLVRPDLGLIAAITGGAALALRRARGERGRGAAALAALALALPLAYEIFRMGYFAAVVPNSALAKEAGLAYWTQGWRYLRDFGGTYALWAPLAVVVALLAVRLPGTPARAALLAAGLAHAAYVTRVGGDFMHARMLLPAWACVCGSVAMAPWTPPRFTPARLTILRGAALLALAWAAFAALALRIPYAGGVSAANIADERGFYRAQAGVAHPVAIEDYAAMDFGRNGAAFRDMAEHPERLARLATRGAAAAGDTTRWVLVDRRDGPLPALLHPSEVRLYPVDPQLDARIRLVCAHPNIGITGFLAGPSVHLVDRLGLSDPVGARLRVRHRGRPGHEKLQPNAWVLARFSTATPRDSSGAQVAAARRLLAQPPWRDLLAAVTEPLTARRFAANVRGALGWSSLRLDPDPRDALAAQARRGSRR